MSSFAFGGATSSQQQSTSEPASEPALTQQEIDQIDQSTPWVAAADGNLPLLKHSLQKLNVLPSCSDSNGLTPLHSAASYHHHHVVRWLFSQENVNVNAPDSDGDTPLHHCDDCDSARVLIEEGKADWSIKNKDGKTALMVKEEELREEMNGQDDEEDSENEDLENLKKLVEYLGGLQNGDNSQTGDLMEG